ncbi:MAG: hypothetical protein ACRC0E_00905 [Soonwooa sp.]
MKLSRSHPVKRFPLRIVFPDDVASAIVVLLKVYNREMSAFGTSAVVSL